MGLSPTEKCCLSRAHTQRRHSFCQATIEVIFAADFATGSLQKNTPKKRAARRHHHHALMNSTRSCVPPASDPVDRDAGIPFEERDSIEVGEFKREILIMGTWPAEGAAGGPTDQGP